MTFRSTLAFVFALAVLAPRAAAQDEGSSWFIGAGLGRTSYDRTFVTPSVPCLKPCVLPVIERGTTATFLVGRSLGDVFSVHASVAPFLERSTAIYLCGGIRTPPSCGTVADVRRWLEYRLALEARRPGRVRPFLGAALGGAGYRRFDSEDRQNRMIWDIRAGFETGSKVGARFEVSRTQHLNPPWDAEGDGIDEGFSDWQVKGVVVFRILDR